MKAELAARGFDHITDTRLGMFINEARSQIDGMYLWPYRRTLVDAAAPITSITDLGVIEAVVNLSSNDFLAPGDVSELVEIYGNLSVAGIPECFYTSVVGGAYTIATFPAYTGTLRVIYFKRTPDLTGTDTPLAPSEFHPLIVRMASQLAYIDTDNQVAAQGLQPWIDQGINRMVESLLGGQQIAGPSRHVLIGDGSCDS